MIFLELFWEFFKIGLFSFGGGVSMMQMIEQVVVNQKGWITSSTLYDFIAISESTPGPIAVNISTYIGSIEGGLLGSFMATLGVVLPSFIVILLISRIFKSFTTNKLVHEIISYMGQVINGLLASFAILMVAKNFIVNYGEWNSPLVFNYLSLIITAILFIIYFGYKKIFKKKMSPIVLILISACLGMLFYL